MALGRGSIEIDLDARIDSRSIARQVQRAERQIRPLSISLDDKGFRQPLGRITGDLSEFQNSLEASVARTLAFGAAVGVVNSLANAFKAMVSNAIEVEKSLADVNVILNLTTNNLANFSQGLFQVAKDTGQSFATVAEAAVELARQGLGAEESLKRINDSMILTRLSGMDAAKSVASLTAAVNSFGDTAITTTEVVNKLASVDAAFAVSTDDLANALARAGASAQGAKVNMDQLLAAVTSVQQQTARGGAVIGNAFKSIFTRLQRSGVREALEEIGVATTDAAGNIRGAMSVLQDYAGVYSSLTDSQRAYTDELVAGVFQINNLKALVKDLGSDYSVYTRALEQSGSATDEAERRNKSLQTTLSALVNEASVNVTSLAASLGELVATPAIENLLKTFNSIAGAFEKALDPETGSKAIKSIFGAIGDFISGPGLVIVGLAFVKLFKFITGQSVKAVSEVFKINTASQKTAKIEAQIGELLKNNYNLYDKISNETLTHEKREELVLKTLQAQTAQYKAQQLIISKLASSSRVGTAVRGAAKGGKAAGFVPFHNRGFIPNLANGVQGAIASERDAIKAGEGGAGRGARTKVLSNFPIGGGRKETMVANTDEVIAPKFGGSSGSAIFNKDMIKKHGMPDGATPVARGFIPNFAVSPRRKREEKEKSAKGSLREDPKFQQFWQGSGAGTGTLTVNTQETTSGFGIIGGRGSPGMVKTGLKGPFANENLASNFQSIVQKKLAINSREAQDFMKLFSKRKTTFTEIPVNTVSNEPITRAEGEDMLSSPISQMIQPQMAGAVANVATAIYSKYFGKDFDTAGHIAGVRKAADKDNQIVSRSVEGGILESALKLGNKESAANIGKDESATWDFEPKGSIPGYLKENFFPGVKVARADAKRSVSDEERGKVLKKATNEVFPAQLAGGILDSIDQRVLKEAKASFARKKSKAGGFIPNFISRMDRKTKGGSKLNNKEFNKLSTAVSRFNSMGYNLRLTNKDKLFNISQSPTRRQKDLGDLRQFFNSRQKRSLSDGVEKKIEKFYKKLEPEIERSYALHSDPDFEGRIAAGDGFIPSFAKGLARPKTIINRLSAHRVDDKKMRPKNAFLPKAEKKGAKKKGGPTGKAQRADPGDVFSATIIPEYQKYTGQTFQSAAGKLTNSYLKGSDAPLNMFKELGADPSNIDGMLTSKQTINGLKDYINSGQDSANLNAWQKATRGGYTKKSFESFLDRKVGRKLRQLYYGAKIKPPKDKKLGGANTGTFQVDDHTKAFKNRVQGILGEVMALKRERKIQKDSKQEVNATLGKGNSFFDLSTGKEVKTVTGKQSAREILKKGANEYLGGKGANGKLFNNRDERVSLRDFPVVLPRGTALAKASGFIPNFARTMEGKGKGAKQKLSAFQKKWIMAVKKGGDIGQSMGLGRGGTESRSTMPQVSNEAQADFERDLQEGTGVAGDMLDGKKVTISSGKARVKNLKATQKDIYAENVLSKLKGAFGAKKWELPGPSPMPGWLSNPIMVSAGDRILDGHHRWATVYARDAIDDGKLGGLSMKTSKIGLPIQSLLKVSEAYSGAKQAGGGTGAASGFIPNFADALDEAITREKKILKAQGSSAKVFADSDPRVAGPKNPMGLLVANTRDEPKGGGQGVERVINSGENPKTHGMTAAKGFVPNFGKVGMLIKAKAGLGKVFGAFEKIAFGAMGVETALMSLNGILGIFDMKIGTLSDLMGIATDKVQGINRPLIDSIDTYVGVIDKQIAANARAIEKVDVLSTATANFSKAVKTGNIDAAGSFMQQIFETASDMSSINPGALKALIDSAGDSEKLVAATQHIKDLIKQGDQLKLFGKDFAEEIKKIGTGDKTVDKVDTQALTKQLTKELNPEQFAKIAKALKDVEPTAANAAAQILSLQKVFGTLDQETQAHIAVNGELSKGLLVSLKAQASYSAALAKLTGQFEKTQLPVPKLTAKLTLLGTALQKAADRSAVAIKAFNLLQKVGAVDRTSRVETAKATGTVKAKDEIGATAATANNEAVQKAVLESNKSIKDFAAKMVQSSEKNITVLSGGVGELVQGITNGTVSNETVLNSLQEVLRTGTTEQKTAAAETLSELKGASQAQIASQAMIEATMRSQLQALDNQTVAFQRNNQLNEGQLKGLAAVSSALNIGQKSSLQKLSELNAAMKTVADLGGNKDILAEMKESNAQLSQLENLKAAFEGLTGDGGVFDASSLDELDLQISQFLGNDSFDKLGQKAQDLFLALGDGVDTARKSPGEVKDESDLTTAISKDSISELANALSVAVSDGMKPLLGISDETAVALNEGESVDVSAVAEELRTLSEANKENLLLNLAASEKYNAALITALQDFKIQQTEDNGTGALNDSAVNLTRAAEALEDAAKKLGVGDGSAGGFVPSFSPAGEGVARAIKTERKLGGRPVVDYNKSIGTYVRDSKTQPNFSSVKRDHPEGLRQATRNSAITQGALTAQGFVPNFAIKAALGVGEKVIDIGGKAVQYFSKTDPLAHLQDVKKALPAADKVTDTMRHLKSSSHLSKAEQVTEAARKAGKGKEILAAAVKTKSGRKLPPGIKLAMGAAGGVVVTGEVLDWLANPPKDPTPDQLAAMEEALRQDPSLTPTPKSLGVDMGLMKTFKEYNMKWTSDLPEITRAAYFGGQEFEEKSGYEAMVDPESLKKAYSKLSRRGIAGSATPGSGQIPGDAVNDITERMKNDAAQGHGKHKSGLLSLVSEDVGRLRNWNMRAPHNKDSAGWRNFSKAMDVVALASLVGLVTPGAPVAAVVGTVAEGLSLGAGAIARMSGSDMNGLFGEAGKADVVNALNSNWRGGFFKKRAAHSAAGSLKPEDFAQDPERAADLALGGTARIEKDRSSALWESWEQQNLRFNPGLFQRSFQAETTNVGLRQGFSEMAGYNLAGAEYASDGKTDLIGALPGGPQFVTDLELAKKLMDSFQDSREDGLRIPLDMTRGQGVGVGFKGWEPGGSPSKWKLDELDSVKRRLSDEWQIALGNKIKFGREESEMKRGPDKTQMQDYLMGLEKEMEGMSSAKSVIDHYRVSLKAHNNTLTDDFMRIPSFPDPNNPRKSLQFQGMNYEAGIGQLAREKGFTRNGDEMVSAFKRDDPSATLKMFFDELFNAPTRENAVNTKGMIANYVSPDIGKALTMLDPAGAKSGFESAHTILDSSNKFIRSMETGEGRKAELEGNVNAQIDRVIDKGDFAEIENRRGFEQGPQLPKGAGADAGDFPEGGEAVTENTKIRDAIYLRLLGEQVKQTRVDNEAEIISTIERMMRVHEVLDRYGPYLDSVIKMKKGSLIKKQDAVNKGLTFPSMRPGPMQVNQLKGEISALEERKALYGSGEPGLAHLFYADASKFTKVNGRVIGPSIWDAPDNALEKYTALRKRLALDTTPAEKRLEEIRQGQGADGESMRAIMGLNFGPGGLTDLQKSEAIGGYGLYAQMRDQQGNEGGVAFQDKFKSLNPDQRLAYMTEFGARPVDPAGANFPGREAGQFEALLNSDSGMKDVVKNQVMRLVEKDGKDQPAAGFLIDQIFSTRGGEKEKDVILNAIKSMGIPINNIAPIDEKLKAAQVKFKLPMKQEGTASALPGTDISSAMDFLYDFQFKEWAAKNKDKMEGDGPQSLSFLNEMLGQTSLAELGKFPSFWNYMSDNHGFNIKQNVGAILKDTDAVANFDKWKMKYGDNRKYLRDTDGKMGLSANTAYGAFKPGSQLTDEPYITIDEDLKAVNRFEEVFGNGQSNAIKVAQHVMGNNLSHGINPRFEELIKEKGLPFPKLGSVSGRAEGLKKIWDVAAVAQKGNSNTAAYMPWGYTAEHQADTPAGIPDKVATAWGLINQASEAKAIPKPEMGKDGVGAEPQIDPIQVPNQIPKARGFVPNFAEILAAKRGKVDLIKSAGKKDIAVGPDGGAVLIGDDGTVAELPSGSSYKTKDLQKLITGSTTTEMTLKALGISQSVVKGNKIKTGEGEELIDLTIPLDDMWVKVKKLKRESSLDLDRPYGSTGIRGASGFVPNFSAVTGEIMASQIAGYKSPVTASQVKTINIPKAGKMAYNTQESVFKMPGITQPFIRPPADSKAASNYKGTVEKKFGFDPYRGAAGGFVPNFAAGAGGEGFAKSASEFQQASRVFSKSSDVISKSVNEFSNTIRDFGKNSSKRGGREAPWKARASAKASKINLDTSAFDSSIEKFNAGVSNFGSAISSMDFTALERGAAGFDAGVSNFGSAISSMDFTALERGAAGFDAGVAGFDAGVSNFGSAISSMDFTALERGAAGFDAGVAGFDAGVSNFGSAISSMDFTALERGAAGFDAGVAGFDAGVSNFGSAISSMDFTALERGAAGFDAGVAGFDAGVSNFGSAISSMDFTALERGAAGFDAGVAGFDAGVSNFGSAISSMDFTALERGAAGFDAGVAGFDAGVSNFGSAISSMDFTALERGAAGFDAGVSNFGSAISSMDFTALERGAAGFDAGVSNFGSVVSAMDFTALERGAAGFDAGVSNFGSVVSAMDFDGEYQISGVLFPLWTSRH